MSEFKKGGKQVKGSVVSPVRKRILELLAGDLKSGATAHEVAFEMDIERPAADRALWDLSGAGHLMKRNIAWPERGGVRAMFYLPEHAELVAARIADIASRVGVEKKKPATAYDAMRDEPPPTDPSAVVPDRAAVWRQPVQPAGFGALAIGNYLPGNSTWAVWASARVS